MPRLSSLTSLSYIFDSSGGINTALSPGPGIRNPNAFDFDADRFGYLVNTAPGAHIAGDRAIVGAPEDETTSSTGSGLVHIYDVNTGAVLYSILADDVSSETNVTGDRFGSSVGIAKNRKFIVGQYAAEGTTNQSSQGVAYIFDSDATLLHELQNPNDFNTGASDFFGWDVSIDSDRAIVGAYNEDSATANGSGVAYIFDVNDGSLLHTLSNPNYYGTGVDDNFGRSVAISGDRAIVGAPFEEDSVGTSSSGVAYIFDVTDGSLLHTLPNPNADPPTSTASFDYFAWSVDISGDRAVVGAWQEDSTSPDGFTASNSGKAFIYDVTDGSLLRTLNNPNSPNNSKFVDQFGWSVSIDSDRVIVGAKGEDSSASLTTNVGAAYIFDVNDGSLINYLRNPATQDSAVSLRGSLAFGSVTAISGNNAIVVALKSNVFEKVYLYQGNASTRTNYTLNHTLIGPQYNDLSFSDGFGVATQSHSMAIAGDYVVVGATFEDSVSATSGGIITNTGKVYVFNFNDGSLVNSFRLQAPAPYESYSGDAFGRSIRSDGTNRVIVGVPFDDSSTGTSGRAYVHSIPDGAKLSTMGNPNAFGTDKGSNDGFGQAVDIDGNRAIVGADAEDDSSGTSTSGVAYIFDVSTEEATLLHSLYNPNIVGSAAGDRFGYDVAISGDYAVIGAPVEDSVASNTGAAFIYSVTNGSLVHQLEQPADILISGSIQFGRSVDIDGHRAVVGAYDGTGVGPGNGSGRAYIYNVVDGSLLHTLTPEDSARDAHFGWNVAISGNRVLVGAKRWDSSGSADYTDVNRGEGRAYLFDANNGSLIKSFANPNKVGIATDDNFGTEVAINNNRLAITAREWDERQTSSLYFKKYKDDADTFSSGRVYCYSANANDFV